MRRLPDQYCLWVARSSSSGECRAVLAGYDLGQHCYVLPLSEAMIGALTDCEQCDIIHPI
jgi:hypothetical protein